MEFEFIEYLGDGQALFQCPENFSFGPASIGGTVGIRINGENLMCRVVDAHVRTRQVILGPIGDKPPPVVVEPEPAPDPSEPIKHEWKKDENGHVIHFGLGDYHDGPQCARCDEIFCRNCEPEKLDEPCGEQTPYLF